MVANSVHFGNSNLWYTLQNKYSSYRNGDTKISPVEKTPVESGQQYYAQENVGKSFRKVDNFPKAQFVDYQENIPPSAGYEAGVSHKTLWA